MSEPPPTPPPAPPSPSPSPAPAPRRGSPVLRWGLRIGAVLVLLLLAALLSRNFLLRRGMEAVVTRVTGFPLSVESFSLGLLDARVDIGGMRLSNTAGFEDPRCLHLPRVSAEMELGSLRTEEVRFREIVLDIREVVVVRNAAGETSLDRLKALGGGGEEGGAKEGGKEGGATPAAPAEEGGGTRWRIDRLELTIGRVVLLDYTRMRDGKPAEEVWDIGVDHEEFRNVDSPEAIVKLIVLKVLQNTPIRLVSATVDSLVGGLGSVVGGAAGVVKGAAGAVGEGVRGIGGAVEGLLGGGKKSEEPPPPPKRKKK
ncbi:MAG: hypothetical protein L6R43_14560 [Planctomycetes bacterium]|nr:hypothetical protein [Planctomycetota bacterium]